MVTWSSWCCVCVQEGQCWVSGAPLFLAEVAGSVTSWDWNPRRGMVRRGMPTGSLSREHVP